MMLNQKLMLIDGNSLLNRAFYGLMGPKMLSTSDGLYTNALYGFMNILIKALNDEKPSHIAVAFDLKAPTFRHEQFVEYKAHRKGMPEELAMQMPVAKELLNAMNIKIAELSGYEADDIIGTLSKSAEKSGAEVIILTGDRDSLQLVSDKVRVKIPITRMGKTEVEEYDENGVIEKYGVKPLQMIEIKSLMGDSSDNIPGVPGIGEKTAFDLIKKYESLDKIYEDIDKLDIKDRIKGLLVENKELAYLSRKLGTIELNVPMDFLYCDCDIKEVDKIGLFSLLKRLEFNSIISKLGLSEGETTAEKKSLKVEIKQITSVEELNESIKEINNIKELAYYPLLAENEKTFSGMAICCSEKKVYFIDFENKALFDMTRNIFRDKGIHKYSYNSKPEYKILDDLEFDVEKVDFDVMIAAYLINPSREAYPLNEIYLECFDENVCDLNPKNADEVCKCASAVFRLTKFFDSKIKELQMEHLYYQIELPLTRVLADMERVGFMVDVQALEVYSAKLEERIYNITNEIIELAGESFNINSTKQLGTILFEKLKLPVIKKTKTGYSTDVEVLENLAPHHPIVDKILDYRQCVKIKSTYVDGMRAVINKDTHKIHSNLNQTVTVTGRISSTEPNLQNIPVKLEMGKQIRKVFIASEGYVLVDADYSQIELRVLAHISGDKNMIDAFIEGQDIHRSTAAKIFGVPELGVTPFMRSSAKAINFGLIYGKGEYSLAKDLRITRKQAKEYIESYFAKFNRVHEYMHQIVDKAKEQGYVSTLSGRRRYLPEINASNFNVRASAERMALNTPIQGTAADIIKIAMVNVNTELKKRELKSRLILQVHDELIIEASRDEVDEVKSILRNSMENAYKLKVPLDIDLHVGKNWYEAK
ncbi:MAG: DNA polymerase I [Deltaproteobacteria bacterium]